jgi:hypothetical protein
MQRHVRAIDIVHTLILGLRRDVRLGHLHWRRAVPLLP